MIPDSEWRPRGWSAGDNLAPRFKALLAELGGWRQLPLVPPDLVERIDVLAHPLNQEPKRRYHPDEHLTASLDVRAMVLKPLGLRTMAGEVKHAWMMKPNAQGARWRVYDHGTRLVDAESSVASKQPRAWWQAPYIDSDGIEVDADPQADAHAYVAGMVRRLNASNLRAVVLGRGSYHFAAVDLMVWHAEDWQDRDMAARFIDRPQAAALPAFDVVPPWFW